jgi:hypothetical protein
MQGHGAEGTLAAAHLGGVFGLASAAPREHVSPPPFLRPHDFLLTNARGGLRWLCQELRPSKLWLPSFLCPVLVPAVADVCRFEFYHQARDLSRNRGNWLRQLQPGEGVLVIDYFGFPGDTETAATARERGAWVIEDACQALLSEHVGHNADFVLYSPRKFVGVPDGGIVSPRQGNGLPIRNHPVPPADWWLDAFSACRLRAEFDRYGGTQEWFRLFQVSEAKSPREPYRMSMLSQALLEKAFDYVEIARLRRRNYAHLLGLLGEFSLFPELDSQTVPLGFPIRIPQRDRVRDVLLREHVFPPIHWPLAGAVPAEFAESHALAAEIMTLPCDQRGSLEALTRMAEIVRKGV